MFRSDSDFRRSEESPKLCLSITEDRGKVRKNITSTTSKVRFHYSKNINVSLVLCIDYFSVIRRNISAITSKVRFRYSKSINVSMVLCIDYICVVKKNITATISGVRSCYSKKYECLNRIVYRLLMCDKEEYHGDNFKSKVLLPEKY